MRINGIFYRKDYGGEWSEFTKEQKKIGLLDLSVSCLKDFIRDYNELCKSSKSSEFYVISGCKICTKSYRNVGHERC